MRKPMPVGDEWPEEQTIFEWVKTGRADAEARMAELGKTGWFTDLRVEPQRRVKKLPDGTYPQCHNPPLPVEWEDVPGEFEIHGTRIDLQAEMQRRFSVVTEKAETRPGCWNYMNVKILMDGEPIGGYQRNYSSLFRTFYPFLHHGEMYALYSRHYTATRVMKLPECVDVCGEEPHGGGFCPTDYFVPYDPHRGVHGDTGFVGGCVWGDDSSYKIEVLDLSRIKEGRLSRDGRLGYIEIPDGMELAECVDICRNSSYVKVLHRETFNLETGKSSMRS